MADHTVAKVAGSGGVPLRLSSEQAAQQDLGAVGVLPTMELSPRGVPVFYHPQGTRAAPTARELHGRQQEADREVNGGEREQGAREMLQDSVYVARNARLLQVACGSAALEHFQDRGLKSRRLEERASPGQRSTPDTDLEVRLSLVLRKRIPV